jgi:PAS domain S-box-containing protein
MRPPASHPWIQVFLVAAGYVLVGHLSLLPPFAVGRVSAIWLPGGLAIAAVTALGQHVALGVLLGSVVLGYSIGNPWPVVLVIALGNTAETMAAATLLRRYVRFRPTLERLRDVVALVIVGGIVTPMISAVAGVGALVISGLLPMASEGAVLRFWVLGNAVGVAAFAPAVLAFLAVPLTRPARGRWYEAVGIAAGTAVLSYFLLLQPVSYEASQYPISFAFFPFLIWAAARFDARGAALVSLGLTMAAVLGFASGAGPFVTIASASALERLQVFVFILAVSGQAIAAIIGERTHAYQRLREGEERLEGILGSLEDAVWSTTPSLDQVLFVNQAVTRIFGRPREDFYNHRELRRECVHPEDREQYLNALRELRQEGESCAEYRIVRPDGSIRWVLDHGRLVRDETGRPIRVDGFISDITSRKLAELERERAESELEGSRQRMVSHLQQTPLAAIDWSVDQRILEWNPAAERIFGYRREEVLNRAGLAFLTADAERAQVEEAWKELLSRGTGFRTTVRNRTRDGRYIICDWYNSPILDGNRMVVGVASLVDEITESMALEEQLRQSQKLEAVGKLAGGVAHDFNNILTAITGHTSLLLGALAPDTPLRADAEAIKQAADRAAGLTNQLLAFSRKQVRAPRVLELPQVVRTLDPLLRRLIGEHISLTTRTVGPPAHVRADPSQLDQVVLNLAINARDAMPNGGAVLIETALVDLDAARGRYLGGLVPGRYGLLTVSDNGPGMDEETRARIFEPFFTTKAMGQGTGLGLSTVYGIVQQSGGYVRVSSAPGAGASFLVYLPHVDAPVDQPAPLPSATVPPRGHETVLLAEDEDAVRRLVSKTLRAQGYRVLDAPDGPAALALAAAHSGPVDLLLTDVVMPGMSGRELAERLSLARPGTRVLFMSGYAADTMDRHGVTEGGQSFLPKPFTLDELARKLRDVLDHN